jgi:hypothetical protein
LKVLVVRLVEKDIPIGALIHQHRPPEAAGAGTGEPEVARDAHGVVPDIQPVLAAVGEREPDVRREPANIGIREHEERDRGSGQQQPPPIG